MKNAHALTVMLALLLLGCSESRAITPDEAASHIGKSGTVEGVVVKVADSPKGHIFLNMGAPFPNQTFTGWVPAGSVATIGRDYLKSVEGKRVSIAGEIKLYKGKPEIVVTKKDQVLVLGQ